VRVLADEIRSS